MTNRAVRDDEKVMSEPLLKLLKSLGKRTTFTSGEFLFQEGEEAEYLLLVESGMVQLSKLTKDGRELTTRLCRENSLLGELALFTEGSRYMLSARVLEDCKVLMISQDELEKQMLESPELSIEFMKWMTKQVRINQFKIRDLVMYGKKGALYSTLIRISNSYGYSTGDGIALGIHLTNNELARFCATTRESTNRMLNDLRKKEVIDFDASGEIFIRNIEYLRHEIGCDECPLHICKID